MNILTPLMRRKLARQPLSPAPRRGKACAPQGESRPTTLIPHLKAGATDRGPRMSGTWI